jgi:hypothetical protein
VQFGAAEAMFEKRTARHQSWYDRDGDVLRQWRTPSRHVLQDGSIDRGGLRYGINSASLRFDLRDAMAVQGYRAYLDQMEDVA